MPPRPRSRNSQALTAIIGLTAAALLGNASAVNLLVNPGFESPALGGVDAPGAGDGWTTFGSGIFTVTSGGGPVQTGNQSLKLFGGCCSGAFQQFPIVAGQIANGSVWIQNFSSDLMAGGQVAAVNIEWFQADGTTQSAITPFISNGTFTAASPIDTWTEQTITGAAPADAAFARFVLITGDFQPGGPGGAPFYDDASFEIIPEPSSFGLLGISLGALLIFRRRRR